MGESLNKAFIFDFDGTLVNSENHIRKTFLKITQQIAPERLSFAKNIVIGPPLAEAAIEILGGNEPKLLNKFIDNFIKVHDENILIYTTAYADSDSMLKEFSKIGHNMAIATNKRSVPTLQIIKHFGWNDFFEFIECSDSELKITNKTDMIKKITKKDNDFKEAFFVGDTINDALAAKSCNLKFIKAIYGYGTEQNWKNISIHRSVESIGQLAKYYIKD